jgi:hypothetical protein
LRPRTLALLSFLIVLIVGLGAVSLGFSSSLLGVLPSKQAVAPTAGRAHGNLLVRAFYTSGAPVLNATVVTRNLASILPISIPYRMNASGELQLVEPPGLYSVEVFNEQFQTSATLNISDGNITLMNIGVNQTMRATVFNELRAAGSSGFAPPWEQVVVAIPANSVLYHSGDTVFIQRYLTFVLLPGQNGSVLTLRFNGSVIPPSQNGSVISFFGNAPGPEIKANVVSYDLRVENKTSLLWLTLKIDNFLPLDLWPGLQLVTYSASTQVSTIAD